MYNVHEIMTEVRQNEMKNVLSIFFIGFYSVIVILSANNSKLIRKQNKTEWKSEMRNRKTVNLVVLALFSFR